MSKTFKKGFGAKVMLFMMAIVFAFSMKIPAVQAEGSQFSIHVIDVGKGDCIAIIETFETPEGEKKQTVILIDAGPAAAAGHVVEYLTKLRVRVIERIYITHYHEDHYGGAPTIMDHFTVKEIVLPVIPKGNIEASKYCSHTNEKFAPFMNRVCAAEKDGKLTVTKHTRGEWAHFGEHINIHDITPEIRANESLSLNDTSILLKVVYGFNADGFIDATFLFLGDATEVELGDFLKANEGKSSFWWNADFIKMPWHGHAHAFGLGERLLDTVQPTYAAISLGGDISRKLRQMTWHGGSGNKPTLDRLHAKDITVFTTDFRGGKDIVAQLAPFGVAVGYAS